MPKNSGCSSAKASSLRAFCKRSWIFSSFSVPRPRSRSSNTSMEGGAMKRYAEAASNDDFFICTAPCTSMSSKQMRPEFTTFSTAS
eukprot:CAMPEP_0115239928 /NCGR_PEP_ID=MMETSP0270-20121206/37650_2 /TAXON_ID=71861 /ORGANISM="Scrippsiella trochoidea, Strain CCMP3099" /LENGTH=85 /DNA_ID=CAMNT_0002654899 /DNA_START=241 /DNA_END=498 /DNA_ORIENTATION=-